MVNPYAVKKKLEDITNFLWKSVLYSMMNDLNRRTYLSMFLDFVTANQLKNVSASTLSTTFLGTA
jgi:hypothetical protein